MRHERGEWEEQSGRLVRATYFPGTIVDTTGIRDDGRGFDFDHCGTHGGLRGGKLFDDEMFGVDLLDKSPVGWREGCGSRHLGRIKLRTDGYAMLEMRTMG